LIGLNKQNHQAIKTAAKMIRVAMLTTYPCSAVRVSVDLNLADELLVVVVADAAAPNGRFRICGR